MRRPAVLFFSLLAALGTEYCPGHAQVLVAAGSSMSPSTLATNPAGPAVEWTVKGTVRDENGTGLPGINVVLKGTTTGTTTDPQGAYSLTVPDGNGTLVFLQIRRHRQAATHADPLQPRGQRRLQPGVRHRGRSPHSRR